MKLALVGCNGFLGKAIEDLLKNHLYDFTSYSHKPIKPCQKNFNTFLKNYLNYDIIIFLLNSHKDSKNIENIINSLDLMEKNKIIFFSTFSIYSDYLSVYAKNKLKQEDLIKKKKNWVILRIGFVESYLSDSLKSLDMYLKKVSYFILLGSNVKTAYINLYNFKKYLLYLINNNAVENKIYNVYSNFLSLKELIIIKKFRGKLLTVNIDKNNFFIKVLIFFKKLCPQKIQSFLSILYLNETYKSEENIIIKNDKYFRNILIYDYLKYNKKFIKHNLFSIRKFVKKITNSITLFEYNSFNEKHKYLYHSKINELLNLNQHSNKLNERNN